MSENLLADLFEFDFELVRFRVLCVLVFLLVFHEHGCDSHIEDEEATDPDTGDEVEADENRVEDVQVNGHDVGPPILSSTDEDCQESADYVIKLCDAEVEGFEIGVGPEVWVIEDVRRAVGVISFEFGAAIRACWALVVGFTA